MSLRVGVVGAGRWSEIGHLPALSRIGGAEVVGIADPELSRARSLAHKFDIPLAVENYQDVLDANLDAVTIAAPDDVHFEIASAAVKAGIHVLSEKPLTRTVDEARRLVALSRSAATINKMVFTFRYIPAVRFFRSLVQDDYVGRPHSSAIISQNPQFMNPSAPVHWKMSKERAGGGSFVEYASHNIDLAQWILGPVESVVINARTIIPQRPDSVTGAPTAVDGDDLCSFLADISGGVEAVFHASWASLPHPWADLAIFGDRGALVCYRMQGFLGEVWGATVEDPEFRPIAMPPELRQPVPGAADWREHCLGLLFQRFADEVRGEVPPEGATFEDGLAVQTVLAALAQSLEERRWVDVEGPT